MGGARDREQRKSGGVLVKVHEAVGSSPIPLAAADAAGRACDGVATATGHWEGDGGSASLPSNRADHAQND